MLHNGPLMSFLHFPDKTGPPVAPIRPTGLMFDTPGLQLPFFKPLHVLTVPSMINCQFEVFIVRQVTRRKTQEKVSVIFICIINKLVILQDHISQPHTGYDKPSFEYLKADEWMNYDSEHNCILSVRAVDFYIKSRISSSLHFSSWLLRWREVPAVSGLMVNDATGTKKGQNETILCCSSLFYDEGWSLTVLLW